MTKQIHITRTIIKKSSTFVNVTLVYVLPIIVIALKVIRILDVLDSFQVFTKSSIHICKQNY